MAITPRKMAKLYIYPSISWLNYLDLIVWALRVFLFRLMWFHWVLLILLELYAQWPLLRFLFA